MTFVRLRPVLDRVTMPLVSPLARLPLHANHWTLIGAGLGVACALALIDGRLWVALVLLVVRGLSDLIDGYKARRFGQRSTFGAVADDVCDRWVHGIIYAAGCIQAAGGHPHAIYLIGFGITGALCNVIAKMSIQVESGHDVIRNEGKLSHPVDVVGVFGSAEFVLYFGLGIFGEAIANPGWSLLAGCWAVAIVSHLSLLQRLFFAWRRYRDVDPEASSNRGS